MPGQPKEKRGSEPRTERLVIRWTEKEKERIARARHKVGLEFDAEFGRLVIEQAVREILGNEPDDVAK